MTAPVALRDQVRAVVANATDVLNVTEILVRAGLIDGDEATAGLTQWYKKVYGDVYSYLRTLERQGRVERYEIEGKRNVFFRATPRLLEEFAVDVPPLRTTQRRNTKPRGRA